jgi:hypothetical protein
MTCKNLIMTLEEGRIRTWRLPAFSALLMFFRASLRTEVRTILAALWCFEGDSQFGQEKRYLPAEKFMLALGGSKSVESALHVEKNLRRRVLPAQRRRGRSVSSGSSVITAPDRVSLLRLGNPSLIALPGLG